MTEKPAQKKILTVDQRTKNVWLKDDLSYHFISSKQIVEFIIVPVNNSTFDIYAKVNRFSKLENQLLDTKKTLTAAKKFVEDYVRFLQKEDFVKNLKGTTFIKRSSVIGFSCSGNDLVALTTSGNEIVLATYKTEENAKEALEYFIETDNYKTEKIKIDETALKALDLLVEEIKQ